MYITSPIETLLFSLVPSCLCCYSLFNYRT